MKDIELDLLAPHHDFPLDTELSMELTESLINNSRAATGQGLLFSSCYNVQVCLPAILQLSAISTLFCSQISTQSFSIREKKKRSRTASTTTSDNHPRQSTSPQWRSQLPTRLPASSPAPAVTWRPTLWARLWPRAPRLSAISTVFLIKLIRQKIKVTSPTNHKPISHWRTWWPGTPGRTTSTTTTTWSLTRPASPARTSSTTSTFPSGWRKLCRTFYAATTTERTWLSAREGQREHFIITLFYSINAKAFFQRFKPSQVKHFIKLFVLDK